MPQFSYTVKSGPGAPESGVMEAENKPAVIAKLREMGYFPLQVEEFEGERGVAALRYQFSRITLKDRNIFFRQLANLFESGMPLTRALTTTAKQSTKPKLAEVITQIRDDVTRGATLAEAMEHQGALFPALYVSLVRAGESGGMLDEVLWRIVTFGEQEEELRGKTSSALVYPIFLILMGSIAIFILMSFVFPKFAGVFEDFNAELPWPTIVTMTVAEFMGQYWWAVIIAVAVISAGAGMYWRTPAGRRVADRIMLRIPLIGDVIHRYEMAKFSRTLGTLMDNGVPVLSSIQITGATMSNAIIGDEVKGLHARVAEGDSISESMQRYAHFPPMVVSMFAVGEESGRIGQVAKRVADAYDTEVDRAVKTMTSMLEPIMIVVMGIIIGFLVISMLLPILRLSAQVG